MRIGRVGRARRWQATGIAFVAGLVLLSVGPDLDAGTLVFHTALDKAVPAADSHVEAAVTELHLIYTTPVQIRLSSISLIGDGGDVDTGELAFLADSEEHGLRVPLTSPLDVGSYSVTWRTAGPDSHPIRGEYSFMVH